MLETVEALSNLNKLYHTNEMVPISLHLCNSNSLYKKAVRLCKKTVYEQKGRQTNIKI